MLPPRKQLLPIRRHLQPCHLLQLKTIPRRLLCICSFHLSHLAASRYISQPCQSNPSNCNYPGSSKPSHYCSSQPSQWYNILPQYYSLQERYSSYLPSSMQLQHSISLYQYLQNCNNKSSEVSSLILHYCCIKHHLLKLHKQNTLHNIINTSSLPIPHSPCVCRHGTFIYLSYLPTILHNH